MILLLIYADSDSPLRDKHNSATCLVCYLRSSPILYFIVLSIEVTYCSSYYSTTLV
jgi:hypothetical protein